MKYIKTDFKVPYYNMAFENYVMNNDKFDDDYFFFYIHVPSIIVGKHQNTIEEINSEYVEKNNIIVANIVNGISNNLVSFLKTSGLIIEHTPNIRNIFAILLPTTFPIAKSECPSNADVTLTTNSGIDVPIATIVSPITISGI